MMESGRQLVQSQLLLITITKQDGVGMAMHVSGRTVSFAMNVANTMTGG
jgi:hypothetical protein